MDTQEWFDSLYLLYKSKMFKIAKGVLGSRETARDVVQDTFIVLLSNQHEVKTYAHPSGFLFATLYKQIGNEMQRQKYRNTVPLDALPEVGLPDTYHFSLADSLPDGLSKKEQEILILFYDECLSHEEIAARLNCGIPACRVRLFRAKNKCEKLLLEQK